MSASSAKLLVKVPGSVNLGPLHDLTEACKDATSPNLYTFHGPNALHRRTTHGCNFAYLQPALQPLQMISLRIEPASKFKYPPWIYEKSGALSTRGPMHSVGVYTSTL